MPGYFKGSLLSALIAGAILAAAQEPVKPKLTPRIITATRQVTMFSNLEIQLLETVRKKDKAGLQNMLTDDFAIDMPSADRLEGDDWLASVMGTDYILKNFGVRQVSISELGNAVVVKFDRLQEATYKGIADNGEFFVVDLWKKDGDTWKLANRFVSKVSSVLPKGAPKPTGKQ